MGISGVLSYLEYALLHKIWVIGFRRNWFSDATMAEMYDLAPVTLTLNDLRVTLDNGRWCSECTDYGGSTYHRGGTDEVGMEKEVIRLRHEKRKLVKDLERYKRQTREMEDLKERWSKLDFKYQLLMDMWTLRTLDNEKPKSPSPTRAPTPHQ